MVAKNTILRFRMEQKDILARLLPDVDSIMDGMASVNFDALMQNYTGLIKLMNAAVVVKRLSINSKSLKK